MCVVWNDLLYSNIKNSKLTFHPNYAKPVISISILIYIIFVFNKTHILQFTLLIFSQQRVTF